MNWWLLLLISVVVYALLKYLLGFTPMSEFTQGYFAGVAVMMVFRFEDKP